jgi:predicted phosphoribosyltransferase
VARPTQRKFSDRRAAGRELAEHLSSYSDIEGLVVFGLPRGGVPVAHEVATALRRPLDVMLVRKLGVPHHEELAFGAIASGGVLVLNQHVISDARLNRGRIEQITAAERLELARREELYRGDRPPLDVRGHTVLVVDDGLATGATMTAAVEALRESGAGSVVAAVPVAARETCEHVSRYADVLECVYTPEPFVAVGQWYEDFTPTTDEEVRKLLD